MPHEILKISTIERLHGREIPEALRPTCVEFRVFTPGEPDTFQEVVFSAGTLQTVGRRIARNARGEWKRKDGTFWAPDRNGKLHPPLEEFEMETFPVDPLQQIEETIQRLIARGQVRTRGWRVAGAVRGASDPHGILSSPGVAAERAAIAERLAARIEAKRAAERAAGGGH